MAETRREATRRGRRELRADGSNRAHRVFLQGLAIDIAVAISVLAYSLASSSEPIIWAIVGGSLARTVVQTIAAYIMRVFLDPSRVPTPLPPAPQPAPAELTDGREVVMPGEVAVGDQVDEQARAHALLQAAHPHPEAAPHPSDEDR